jgi:uncharacterized phage-like protein YoqJ
MRSSFEIREELDAAIRWAIASGFRTFISGMSRGVDFWAADIVLKHRTANSQLHLICACPFPAFEARWSMDWQRLYSSVLSQADFVRYICPAYSPSCFQLRNEWMVNHAARVIAVFNNKPSGTMNTIEYAIRQNVPVEFIKG